MNTTRAPHARPTARCPRHNAVLDEGPVQYQCPHGHRVQAADISKEVTR